MSILKMGSEIKLKLKSDPNLFKLISGKRCLILLIRQSIVLKIS